MENYIDTINFYELEAQKYWTPPASWTTERKKQETENAIFSGDYIGARKMDGAFYKFLKDEDGNMKLLGRSKSVNGEYLNKIEWVPQLYDLFNKLPNGTCLLGEIYFPNNEGSNHVTTIMGCLKDKALARQEKGDKLHYYIFDILAFDGKSFLKMNIEDRVEKLILCRNTYGENFCEWAEYYEGEDLWNNLQTILIKGGEGIVITKKKTCYQPGKRPARQTFKVKKELQETIDVVITSINSPTRIYSGKEIMTWKYWQNVKTGEKLEGEFYNDYQNGFPIEPITKNFFHDWAGSFNIGIRKDERVIPIGSLSGMTEEVLSNWKDYIGKIAEISGMEIFRDDFGNFSGIRHPKFVCWRPDLTVKDTDWYRL